MMTSPVMEETLCYQLMPAGPRGVLESNTVSRRRSGHFE
jgi:hypothetical protein